MTRYRFEDIAYNSTEKKKPVEEDKYTYIGLEHLDPQCLDVTRFGSEVAPIGEKLIMKKGDVLFGKRRAYQKKVAIAPFDGIFSAHGMVLRPKEKVIDPKFFPMFIASDYFLDAAIKISVGSLSPTINWNALKELEFELPDLNKQRKLAELLWAAEETKQAYKKLIEKTERKLQAEFIKKFNPESTVQKTIEELFLVSSGGTPSRSKIEYWDNGNINWVKISDMYNLYTDKTKEYITELGLKNSSTKLYKKGTYLFSIFATLGVVSILDINSTVNQAIAGLEPKCDMNKLYMYYALRSLKTLVNNIGQGAAQNNINLSILKKLVIPFPSIEDQNYFGQLVECQLSTKREIEKAIEQINNIKKSLLYNNSTREVSHV